MLRYDGIMNWKTIFVLSCFGMLMGTSNAQNPPGAGTAEKRTKAQKLQSDGNWKDALVLWKELMTAPDNAGKPLAEDTAHLVECLGAGNIWGEFDELMDKAVTAHPKDWRLLAAVAAQYSENVPHWGLIIENRFQRGGQGSGKRVGSADRDRVRAMQLLEQAFVTVTGSAEAAARDAEQFYALFAETIASRESWELQALTDLKTLPDYDEQNIYGRRFGGRGMFAPSADRGAPVDEKGDPVFHHTPQSWDTSASDGERWRFVLTKLAACGEQGKEIADTAFARFLKEDFDVHTMAQWWRPMEDDDEKNRQQSIFAVHTLKETETIARLATGVKRFTLPEEFNFITMFLKLAETAKNEDIAKGAFAELAGTFQDRRQLVRAAEILLKQKQRFPKLPSDAYQQIVGNWGRFDGSMVQTPGVGAKVGFTFRNATLAHFKAREIHFPQLLEDVRKYLASDPESIDWQKTQIGQIGWQILEDNNAKYVGKEVAKWDLELKPRDGHWDRRIDVTTPLQTPGAYLLEAQVEQGNKVAVLVWITDTVIVKKAGGDEIQYFVVDAVTGAPVSKATVDFFGWHQKYLPAKEQKGKRRAHTVTKRLTEFTDENGQYFGKKDTLDQNLQWLVTATTDKGRFAHLGFSNVWYPGNNPDFFEQTKIYVITDRPVYRPGQPVKFKAWVRRARYDAAMDKSEFANQKWQVEILDGKGVKFYEKSLTSDQYGGINDELVLKEDAALGVCQFHIFRKPNEHLEQQGSFRVEEYKKPEFEVKVDAPADPVMLGEKVPAKVTAKYFFGAPVVNAKVKYKVQRSAHESRWYPVRPWDWFYGPGYWWFCYDYDWYPGWKNWGCLAPHWWWGGHSADPPEVVLENEAPIGPDGTVTIDIDTALAKEPHGDEDHRYEIAVEVTDESRRTIVGKGSVLVARQPFKVNLWTDRGHYEVGQEINLGIKAHTLDHKGVKGDGKVQLFKLSYNDKGEPQEREVKVQDFKTDGEGSANLKFSATEAGQYRFSAKVTDAKGRTVEGGYVIVIRGQGMDGRDFRFAQLEIVPEKAEYAPGEEVKLLINTERAGSTVFFYVRSSQGVAPRPQVLKLDGKSATQVVKVALGDMPNFFVEAFTVSDGNVHKAVKEIVVPPAKRVLNLEVLADAAKHKPRDQAKVKIKLTDLDGKPFVGSTVVTVYDKALEYISGGSNVPDIKEYFWKWRRHYSDHSESSVQLAFPGLNLPRGSAGMNLLGVFGDLTGDTADDPFGDSGAQRRRSASRGGPGYGGVAKSRGGMAPPMPMAAPMPAEGMDGFAASSSRMAEAPLAKNGAAADAFFDAAEGGGAGAPAPQVMIRTDFADAIHWTATVETNAEGEAHIEVPLPDNLTTWKIKSWGMGHGTRVGEGEAEVITSKDLILRQQAPRFFVEKDEVVLSANVHNYLPDKKDVKVSLELDSGCLEVMPGQELTRTIALDSQKEQRVDWRVKAVREGTAVVRMKAITDKDSDAMEMKYPVYVHGMLKTDSYSGAIRPEATAGKVEVTIPNERRPEQSRIEVRYSPTIATAIVDAVPYLADYPYGCTEQTLNRFLPALLARKLLQDMGIDLAAVQAKRSNLNPQEIGDDKERMAQWKKRYVDNVVFDAAEYDKIVKQGLQKLVSMQNRDGGWGWFSGEREQSYPHTTAVVVHGLLQARAADLAIPQGVLENGLAWLKAYEQEQVENIKLWEKTKGDKGKPKADNLDAFDHMVLTEGDVVNAEMREFLYRDRNGLAVYAKCVYGLALAIQGQEEKRDMLVKNIEQFLVIDNENQSARLDLRNGGFWWWWYGSEFEAQAFYLKLLAKIDPKSEKASGLVKYIVNNRKNATWWTSTRDTAYCVEALNDYLKATKENEPEVTVQVLFDGQVKKEVKITKENLFSYDNAFVLEGAAVPAGKHTVEIKKTGKSPVYFNAYVTNFTLEDRITRAGLEVKIDRKYYKLTERKDAKAQVSGSRGQVINQKVLKYDRAEIRDGAELKSGDLIEVELLIESKNDYEYLVFEDMKAAGFEAEDVRSGYVSGDGLGTYREFRDERVAMFVRALPLGKHSLTYRLRAEVPGKFSALPAKASAMYAPELRANSDEMKLGVAD